ncbi:MAG: hypothetical protein WCI51_02505 [Lentisphaerota bacterium]
MNRGQNSGSRNIYRFLHNTYDLQALLSNESRRSLRPPEKLSISGKNVLQSGDYVLTRQFF